MRFGFVRDEILQNPRCHQNNPSLIVEIGNSGFKRLVEDGHDIESRAIEILKKYEQITK